MLKVFQSAEDQNIIYFRNFERIPPEEEIQSIVTELKNAGYEVGSPEDFMEGFRYTVHKDELEFYLFYPFDDDGPALIFDNQESIEKVKPIFNWSLDDKK